MTRTSLLWNALAFTVTLVLAILNGATLYRSLGDLMKQTTVKKVDRLAVRMLGSTAPGKSWWLHTQDGDKAVTLIYKIDGEMIEPDRTEWQDERSAPDNGTAAPEPVTPPQPILFSLPRLRVPPPGPYSGT